MATLAISPVRASLRPEDSAMAAFKSAASVEEQLRHVTQIKRIRVSEFFKDFDPLRSGYITKTQFRRCLDQHLGLRLSEEDYKVLVDKYDIDNGMVNYRNFSETLEKVFDPDQLDVQPSTQVEVFQKSAQPLKNTVSEDTIKLINGILLRCHDYYEYHGISVKSCYTDFDRHHRGFVTASQFHRSFPGPAEVSPAEITALAQYYYDPVTGLHNYLQFHNDIVSLDGGEGEVKLCEPFTTSLKKSEVASLDEIFERIRDAIYKNGIRTTEFFRDHDKLRSGVITENQFICGLMVCCGSVANLTRDEIQRVVDYYRTPDGRVRYKEFCHLMENSYNVPDLEKKPTATVSRPLRGHLTRPLNALSSKEEEQRLEEVLERLKTQVRTRRLMLYPYFRDFDRGKGYTRGVTKPQFERLLHFQSLQVTPQELELIVTKFQYPNGGDVNYVAFIQAIDEEYTGQAMEQENSSKSSDSASPVEGTSTTPTQAHLSTRHPSQPPTAQEPVNLDQLVSRLQEHVLCNRIRVSEHFQDFDPLRSGSISTAKFRQGLSSMGQPYLTEEQFSLLCQCYADPKRKDYICWKKFLQDVDQVFFQPAGTLNLARPGTINFENQVPDGEKQTLEEVMFTLSEKVKQRRVLVKPCFEDFDRHNMGYVTCNQFHQCLAYLGLGVNPAHMRLLEMRFADQKGFNYLKFLDHLQPSEKLENKYQTRMAQLMSKKEQVRSHGIPQTNVNAEDVLVKVKTKVCKERIRVLEFMRDYDKLRSGRISLTSFRRALDLCGFELSPPEVVALENRYLSSKDPSCVNYMTFSDEVESIFTTKHLEKDPTAEVVQFVPNSEVDCNCLSPEEEQILQKTLHRLAERVRVRRIQIFPLFEDYDRVHIGSVTRTQFHRVLSELELGGLVNALEFVLLYRKFDVKVGGRNDVNYYAFCEMIDDYAQTKWSDPTLK